MAHIQGERFTIDLDDDAVAPDELPGAQRTASNDNANAGHQFMGDVIERKIDAKIAAPSFKSQTSGFPAHRKRSGVSQFKSGRKGADPDAVITNQSSSSAPPDSSIKAPRADDDEELERLQIDAENKKVLANMSNDEIESERQELFSGLSPALIQRLLQRSNIDDEPQASWEPEMALQKPPSFDEKRRPSSSERRVSFALPDEQIRTAVQHNEPTPTAARHSITSSPSPRPQAKLGALQEVSDLSLTRSLSGASTGSRRSSSSHGHERRVSFVLPDYIEQARKIIPSAVRHSVNSPSPLMMATDRIEPVKTAEIANLELNNPPELATTAPKSPEIPLTSTLHHTTSSSSSRSAKDRPSFSDRKVSFALPDTEPEHGRRPSTAAQHSVALSPSPALFNQTQSNLAEPLDDFDLARSKVPLPTAAESSIHFPKPPAAPELDPNSDSFLDDLHQKYFPDLAHDPSKLAWMQPATDEENAAYDPSRANLDPKDVRFDFKGQIIPPSKSLQISTDLGLHHHGDAPSAAGYTIAELGRLCRSAFPAQRSIAIQTIGRILFRLGQGEFGDENDIGVAGPEGDRAVLAKGLWDAVGDNRVIDSITEEADKDHGHQTSIALAQEAVWNWRKGGGRQRKAV